MIYDTVIIGTGLAGLSAAMATIPSNKKIIIVSKGMGNVYSSSGYIDLIGYYPFNEREPVKNPLSAVSGLISENPSHPYSLIGEDIIKKAFSEFIKISNEMGLPYGGTLESNILIPTVAGSLIPATIHPKTSEKNIMEYDEIIFVGIEELIDFYPLYAENNLRNNLNKKIKSLTITLGLNMGRELNSYDLAIAIEKKSIREKFINQLLPFKGKGVLFVVPAVLGLNSWKLVIDEIEGALNSKILEIPTMPPSVMGYRLAESLMRYLKKKGVEFLIGNPVTYVKTDNGRCEEIGINTINDRIKKIKGKNFILATGGILGEGLLVKPDMIKEEVFNLPLISSGNRSEEDFFNLKGQPLSYAGVKVNNKLQPVDPGTDKVILENVFVAGATLAGYDPFIEKSGNGVALASGYKAGLMAIESEDHE